METSISLASSQITRFFDNEKCQMISILQGVEQLDLFDLQYIPLILVAYVISLVIEL